MTQLVSAVRRVAREVPGAAAVIAAQCTGHDYSKPGKPQADWSDPAAGDALAPALVNDANAVVAAFEGRRLDDRAGRSLDLHEHDALLRAARAEWPAIREDYKAWRPDVERAVAQAATQRGAASSPATAEPPPMMPG